MNVLLLQNNLCVRDLSEGVIKKYPRSSVIETSGFNFPSKRPILSDKWLIRLKLGRSISRQLTNAAKIKDIANFIFVSDKHSDSVLRSLNDYGFDYQVVDNLRPDIELLTAYVKNELGVADPVARHIVDRSNRYEPLIIKNVQLLSLVTNKKLSRANVDKYLQDSSGVSFTYFYRFILLKEGEYGKIVKLVYRYQNSLAILCNFLINKLKQDINLFQEIMDGNLCKDNYIAYAEQKKVSAYTLQQAMLLFDKVTLETLYAKLLVFESLLGKNCAEFILKGCRQ